MADIPSSFSEPATRSHRVFDWLFRSRTTGRITIAQFPNLALGLFIMATIVRWLVKPSGTAGGVLSAAASGALAVWALDELVRGVNPWRRMLGAGALAWLTLRLV